MLTTIKNTIRQYEMLESTGTRRVIVAFSGGADSVSLLYAMHLLKDELGIGLEACHVNHNLRGAESENDELFVRCFCTGLSIPLTVRSIDVKSLLKKHVSTEECARNARYSFFDEISGNALIATAHNADDNCETVLLNLLRGTALKGLCGIPPVRGNIIRPLINTARLAIELFCKEHNLQYVTDSTNLSEKFTRNRLRLNIFPLLEEINPSLNSGVGRMCRTLREDEAFLSKLAEEKKEAAAVKTPGGNRAYDASLLSVQPSPLLNRIITSILTQNNISPSSLRISEIAGILKNGNGKINIQKDIFAIVKNNVFYLENIHQKYRKKT